MGTQYGAKPGTKGKPDKLTKPQEKESFNNDETKIEKEEQNNINDAELDISNESGLSDI